MRHLHLCVRFNFTAVRLLYATLLACSILQSAHGQSSPIACTMNTGVPPVVRSEEVAAKAGDLLIVCTGGTPTVSGQTVPFINVQIFTNTNLTVRLASDGSTASEALLMIDEPVPGSQTPCTSPQAGCTLTAGVPGPNVFQAVQTGSNSVTFLNVPLDPPGIGKNRVLRITNVRVNAPQLGVSSGLIPTAVNVFVSMSGPYSLTLTNPQVTFAFVQLELTTQLRTADNEGLLSSASFQGCLGANRQRFATLRFAELFGTAL